MRTNEKRAKIRVQGACKHAETSRADALGTRSDHTN